MTDKVYPTSKPAPPPVAATTASAPPAAAAAKPHLYNPNRRRPQPPPPRRRRCRFSCCLCVIYSLIVLLCLILLAAIAASVFYLLYHPKHPTFSLTALRLTSFNLSSSPDPASPFSHLASSMSVTLISKNPNPKIEFLYDAFSISLTSSGGIDVGDGSLPGFSQAPGNTTVISGTVASDPKKDLDSVDGLRSDLGKKNGFPIVVKLDTKVEVRMGKVRSKRVGIRVTCDGIRGFVPKRNATSKKITPATANASLAKCKVDLRIKIWRFTF